MSEATTEAPGEEQEAPKPEPKLVYEIEIDLPDLPKGELVQIPGLGTYENGKAYDVNEDEHAAYRAYHSRQEPEYDEHDRFLGSTLKIGPTLLQASKTMYGVEVTTYADGGGN